LVRIDGSLGKTVFYLPRTVSHARLKYRNTVLFHAFSPTKMGQSDLNIVQAKPIELNDNPCTWSLADTGILLRRGPFEREHFHREKAKYTQTLAPRELSGASKSKYNSYGPPNTSWILALGAKKVTAPSGVVHTRQTASTEALTTNFFQIIGCCIKRQTCMIFR